MVTLEEEVEVNDAGEPELSPWFIQAFCNGEATKRRLRGDGLRKEHEEAPEPQRQKDEGPISYNVTVGSVVVTGRLDLVSAGELVSNQEQGVHDVLAEHVELLYQLFAVYSGAGIRPSTHMHGLSCNDFAHILHISGVRHAVDHGAMIQDIYQQSVETSGLCLMTATTFQLGLIKLATRMLEAGNMTTISLTDVLENIVGKLSKMVIESKTNGGVLADLTDPVLASYLHSNWGLLYEVYCLYADNNDDGAMITLPSFVRLMDDCVVMSSFGATSDGKTHSENLAVRSFFTAQGMELRPHPSRLLYSSLPRWIALLTWGDLLPLKAASCITFRALPWV
ncbi:unnamed protein product [Chrysoparadoxa australica]